MDVGHETALGMAPKGGLCSIDRFGNLGYHLKPLLMQLREPRNVNYAFVNTWAALAATPEGYLDYVRILGGLSNILREWYQRIGASSSLI